MAWWTVVRALFGYLFLVFVVRIVGRRPGKQLAPFEYVLVFFLGGLTLTGIVGADASLINALCQIVAVAGAHFLLVWVRQRSELATKVLDGTPLVLLEKGRWRARTMRKMRIAPGDVMSVARSQGMKSVGEIETAVLERNGEMSILKRKQ